MQNRQARTTPAPTAEIKLGHTYCAQKGWLVAKEFVEPGASGTNENRPVLQQMIELACSSLRPFDILLVHSYSRYFRDAAVMELTICNSPGKSCA